MGITPVQKRLIDAYLASAEGPDTYVSASELLRNLALSQLSWSEERYEMEIQEVILQVGSLGSHPPESLGFYYRELLALAQPWRCRYPLFEAKGMPVGDLHDDDPSGPDFVEVCLSKAAQTLMPRGRPPALPMALLNGSLTPQETNVPAHNLYELWMAQEHVRQDPSISLDDLMEVLPGPDFPTGAVVSDLDAVRLLYEKGRAVLTLRAVIDQELQGGRTRVAVTALPPGVLIRSAIEGISNLSRSGRLRLYSIQNASQGNQVRIVIDAPRELSSKALKEALFREGGLERRVPYQIVPEGPIGLPPAESALASVLRHAVSACSPAWQRKDGKELHRVPTLKEIMEFGGYRSPLSDLVDPRRSRVLALD